MSIRDLKKNRASLFAKLQTEVDKIKNGTGERQTDDRFWQPTRDKVGNAVATIRFLPLLSEEELPWVKFWSHGFKSQKTGMWYIENCPTTLGQSCPICKDNSVLWNTGIERDKSTVRDRKRKLHYISNIMIINDPAIPENEGKVFLFKFGKKIFDKIMEAMYPQFQDEKPVNPFDPWEGAELRLKVRRVEGYTNYDKSVFSEISALSDDDSEIEKILKTCYPLNEFVEASQFKSYEDLNGRFIDVCGEEREAARPVVEEASDEDDDEEEDNLPESFTKPEKVNVIDRNMPKIVKDNVVPTDVGPKLPVPIQKEETEDEVSEYLRRMAEED